MILTEGILQNKYIHTYIMHKCQVGKTEKDTSNSRRQILKTWYTFNKNIYLLFCSLLLLFLLFHRSSCFYFSIEKEVVFVFTLCAVSASHQPFQHRLKIKENRNETYRIALTWMCRPLELTLKSIDGNWNNKTYFFFFAAPIFSFRLPIRLSFVFFFRLQTLYFLL